MTSITDSRILTSGSVSARSSGIQHANRAYDQGYWEGDRRGVGACSTSSAPLTGVVRDQCRSDLLGHPNAGTSARHRRTHRAGDARQVASTNHRR
jgi:hypothetical protein